jgi:hypothetical protein
MDHAFDPGPGFEEIGFRRERHKWNFKETNLRNSQECELSWPLDGVLSANHRESKPRTKEREIKSEIRHSLVGGENSIQRPFY